MLGANKIEKIEHLHVLGGMHQLLQLDLINNPVSKLPGYREKVFAMFPSLTVLDTLDKIGKDAYTSSSMADAVSRIPDSLFDKGPVVSAPAPVPFSAPLAFPVSTLPAARKAPKPKHVPVAKTVTSKMPSKGAKGAKLSKVTGSARRTTSQKAGLVFPTGRIKRKIKEAMPTVRVAKSSSVYLASVLEYLTAEILEIAGNLTKNEKKLRITPSHIKRSLKGDDELFKLLTGITFSMNEWFFIVIHTFHFIYSR